MFVDARSLIRIRGCLHHLGSTYSRSGSRWDPPAVVDGWRAVSSPGSFCYFGRDFRTRPRRPTSTEDGLIGAHCCCWGNGPGGLGGTARAVGHRGLLMAIVPLWMVLLDWWRPRGTSANAGLRRAGSRPRRSRPPRRSDGLSGHGDISILARSCSPGRLAGRRLPATKHAPKASFGTQRRGDTVIAGGSCWWWWAQGSRHTWILRTHPGDHPDFSTC